MWNSTVRPFFYLKTVWNYAWKWICFKSSVQFQIKLCRTYLLLRTKKLPCEIRMSWPFGKTKCGLQWNKTTCSASGRGEDFRSGGSRPVVECSLPIRCDVFERCEEACASACFACPRLPASVHPLLPSHTGTVLAWQVLVFPSVSPEVITRFVRRVVSSEVEDYDSSWGLISLSRCILSKRDTVLIQMSPLIQRKGDRDRNRHSS